VDTVKCPTAPVIFGLQTCQLGTFFCVVLIRVNNPQPIGFRACGPLTMMIYVSTEVFHFIHGRILVLNDAATILKIVRGGNGVANPAATIS
jgi:hypothetical protein